MIRGIYTAGSGLLSHSRSLDVIGNNIANARTAGYKSSLLTTRPFDQQMALRMESGAPRPFREIGGITLGRKAVEVVTSFDQGILEETGRRLDFAIAGDGFFTIEDSQGRRFYTRNGQFSLDQSGFLCGPQGGRLLGRKGPIQVKGDDFTVNEAGEISLNGNVIDRLDIYLPAATSRLTKFGEGIFVESGTESPRSSSFTGRIIQGSLETSNVDMAKEMTNLMAASRGFQSCSQVVKMFDRITEKTVTEIGRL